MRSSPVLSVFFLAATGCVSVHIGPDDEFFRVRGLAHAHGSVGGLDNYDGSILDIGLLTNTRGHGELLSVEVGPFVGFGVGVVGARVRVLPLELGLGVGFYDPRPASVRRQDDDEERDYYEREDTDESARGDQATTPKDRAK